MTDATTLLVITGIGVPPYSARGLTQTLVPIAAAGAMRRTVNGTLTDLSAAQFRKFSTKISCTDQQPPAFEGVWQGLLVVIDCIVELAYLTAAMSTDGPGREVVADRIEGDFTFYRPRLTMRVTGFNVSRDEYGATLAWDLSAEEV